MITDPDKDRSSNGLNVCVYIVNPKSKVNSI